MRTINTILKIRKAWVLTFSICALTFCLHAQKETELFIPIGKSPGVSGKYSLMGRIDAVNMSDSTVTIKQDAGGKTTIRITATCAIYLDKSKLKLSNKKGYCADIKQDMVGRQSIKIINQMGRLNG